VLLAKEGSPAGDRFNAASIEKLQNWIDALTPRPFDPLNELMRLACGKTIAESDGAWYNQCPNPMYLQRYFTQDIAKDVQYFGNEAFSEIESKASDPENVGEFCIPDKEKERLNLLASYSNGVLLDYSPRFDAQRVKFQQTEGTDEIDAVTYRWEFPGMLPENVHIVRNARDMKKLGQLPKEYVIVEIPAKGATYVIKSVREREEGIEGRFGRPSGKFTAQYNFDPEAHDRYQFVGSVYVDGLLELEAWKCDVWGDLVEGVGAEGRRITHLERSGRWRQGNL